MMVKQVALEKLALFASSKEGQDALVAWARSPVTEILGDAAFENLTNVAHQSKVESADQGMRLLGAREGLWDFRNLLKDPFSLIAYATAAFGGAAQVIGGSSSAAASSNLSLGKPGDYGAQKIVDEMNAAFALPGLQEEAEKERMSAVKK